jgi:hypothetical protein
LRPVMADSKKSSDAIFIVESGCVNRLPKHSQSPSIFYRHLQMKKIESRVV